jgi:hypothetical protein
VIFRAAKTGPNSTAYGKTGSKRHFIFDGAGTPLAIRHIGANVYDSETGMAIADRAYDAQEKIRRPFRNRGVVPLLARRYTPRGSGPGRLYSVVEAAFDRLFNNRPLRVRYERRDDIYQAFLSIGCQLISWRRIQWYRQSAQVSAQLTLEPWGD